MHPEFGVGSVVLFRHPMTQMIMEGFVAAHTYTYDQGQHSVDRYCIYFKSSNPTYIKFDDYNGIYDPENWDSVTVDFSKVFRTDDLRGAIHNALKRNA